MPQDSQASQSSQTPDGVPERGGDDTIEMMSNISSMAEEESACDNDIVLFGLLTHRYQWQGVGDCLEILRVVLMEFYSRSLSSKFVV